MVHIGDLDFKLVRGVTLLVSQLNTDGIICAPICEWCKKLPILSQTGMTD